MMIVNYGELLYKGALYDTAKINHYSCFSSFKLRNDQQLAPGSAHIIILLTVYLMFIYIYLINSSLELKSINHQNVQQTLENVHVIFYLFHPFIQVFRLKIIPIFCHPLKFHSIFYHTKQNQM